MAIVDNVMKLIIHLNDSQAVDGCLAKKVDVVMAY